MGKYWRSTIAAIGLACVGFPANAGEYELISVVDSTDMFASFSGGRPQISADGYIGFRATKTDGTAGVYVRSPEGDIIPIVEIATEETASLGGWAIGAAGWASYQISDNGVTSLVAGNGVESITLADTNGEITSMAIDLSMNAFGDVSFFGHLDFPCLPECNGVFVADEKSAELFVGPSDQNTVIKEDFAINDSGSVAFRSTVTGEVGDMVRVRPTARPDIDIFQAPDFGPVSVEGMNNAGTVIFTYLGPGSIRSILVGAGTGVETVVEEGQDFLDVIQPSINNAGEVVFKGLFDDDGITSQGVFIGADVEMDLVIARFEKHFGGVINLLNLSRKAIDDDGQIVFQYTLNDGLTGIGLATREKCNTDTGDLNCDGVVDTVDLLILLGDWGPCKGCPADLSGDNIVDTVDLLQLLGAWG